MSVLGVAILTCLLQAQEPPPVRKPWDGFAPGSTVVKTLTNDAGIVWCTSTEVIESLGTDGVPVIHETTTRESRTSDGNPVPLRPFATGLREDFRRQETIAIKDRKLDCDVVAYTGGPGNQRGLKRLTVWYAKEISLPPRRVWAAGFMVDVPATVVRVDSVEVDRETTITATLEVLRFHQKIVVKGDEIDGGLQESRSLSAHPSRLGWIRSRREWLSPEVPGAVVRCEQECGTAENTGRDTEEVVEFKAIR